MQEFTIRFRGRTATIFIYSGENPDSLKGANLAAAGIDEPFIQDQKVFEQILARVRHPNAKHKELAMTGTPEQLGWGFSLVHEEDESKKLDVGVVRGSTRANRALDPAYVKRLEQMLSPKAAQAYIEGHFVNLAEGQVYYGFNMARNIKKLEIPWGAELGVGMDFNVNPMSAAVFWKVNNHMHYIEELELPNADTSYMCETLREKYCGIEARNKHKGELLYVYPDASGASRHTSSAGGRSDFHIIRDMGFQISAAPTNPHRKDRYNAVNAKLSPKSGEPTITIDPSCKKLIKYLSTYSHELMNKQEEMSHLLDAFSYPVYRLCPLNREIITQRKLSGL